MITANRFLRADEQAQSIKKLFDLNIKGSIKIVFKEYSEYVKKSLVKNRIFWPMKFIFNALV